MIKVGYVGLGAMGRALARRLIEPFGVAVWDLAPAAVDGLVAQGAVAASSLRAMAAESDVILLCLPTSGIVETALFGDDGLATHIRPGATVIDQTSGIPAQTRGFAKRLAARGVSMLDAPVAGGVPSAIAGQITIMVSGPADVLDRTRPVLSAISPKLFRCGDNVGDGQATKAINNLVNTGYRMATLELLGLASRMRCPAGALTDRLNAGEARSFVTQRLLPAVVEGRSSADFALGLMCKDVNQAADLALEAGVVMPVSDAARSLMTVAWRILGDDSRLDDLVPFMERLAAVEFVGGDADTSDHGETIEMVEIAMAAANRAIMKEAIDLASCGGLDLDLFASVMAAGSGASVQGDRLLAGEDRPDGRAVEILNTLSRHGAHLGVPMTVTSQVRAAAMAAG